MRLRRRLGRGYWCGTPRTLRERRCSIGRPPKMEPNGRNNSVDCHGTPRTPRTPNFDLPKKCFGEVGRHHLWGVQDLVFRPFQAFRDAYVVFMDRGACGAIGLRFGVATWDLGPVCLFLGFSFVVVLVLWTKNMRDLCREVSRKVTDRRSIAPSSDRPTRPLGLCSAAFARGRVL